MFPCLVGYASFSDPNDLLQFTVKDSSDNKYYCTLCDKFSHASRNNTTNLVESYHFPNMFSYGCDQCDQVFGSKSNFAMHK